MFSILQKAILFFLSNQAFFRSALLWISLWKLWITHRRIVYLEYYVNLSLPQISCRSFRRFVGKAHTSPLFGNFCRNCRILFLLFCRILCRISPFHFAGTLQNILFVYHGKNPRRFHGGDRFSKEPARRSSRSRDPKTTAGAACGR